MRALIVNYQQTNYLNQDFYNIEDKHINPLNNIAYQLMLKEKNFGQNMGRMDYLHKDFEFYKGKFNSNNRIRLSKKEVQTNEALID